MNLQIDNDGDVDGVVRLCINGELDLSTAPELLSYLQSLFTSELSELVFDLSELEFVDSTGLNVFVMANKKLRAEGKKLIFASSSPQFMRLLEMTGLNEYFNFQ